MPYTPDLTAELLLPSGKTLVVHNKYRSFTVFHEWAECYKGCYTNKRRYYVIEYDPADPSQMSIISRCSGCDYGYDLVYECWGDRLEGEIPEKVMKVLRRNRRKGLL